MKERKKEKTDYQNLQGGIWKEVFAMMRSFYDGMWGIKNHQVWLDVISDNITNVNTHGYKRSRVTFETVFSEVISTAIAPRGERGGINPKQIGLGATVATIQTLHVKGNTEATNKKTDLAIEGDGYFILRDGYTETKYYTRAGAFDFDPNGYLVNPSNGFRVQGWGAERDEVTRKLILDPITGKSSIDTSKPLSGIRVTLGEHLPPKATENIKLYSNLDADSPFMVDQIHTFFKKGIESVVGVSGSAINTSATWAKAGFAKAPDGTITINGTTFSLDAYPTPQALMTAINQQESVGVYIEYDAGLDIFRITPKDYEIDISLSEKPKTPGHGFFTQAKIAASRSETAPYTYNTGNENKIIFTHIFEPTNPDKIYIGWRAVDPDTFKTIETNSYYYVANERITIKNSGGIIVADLPHGTVDPTTLSVMVDGVTLPTTDYKFMNNEGEGGLDKIGWFGIPDWVNRPKGQTGIVTVNYYYNKTVKAQGILELNEKGLVINNYINTEAFPEITSSIEVRPGPDVVNLTISNPWSGANLQFRSPVDGTITISTPAGTFTSRDIRTYPNVQALISAINASVADVTITYDVATDKFTLRSDAPGDMTLSQTGTFGFFSAVNIPTGTVSGGNNNGVFDLALEIPRGEDGWPYTTGIAGSGKDFYRVNTDRASFTESSPTTINEWRDLDPGPDVRRGYDLFYPDVDWTILQIRVVNRVTGESALASVNADRTLAGTEKEPNFWFNDNAGPFGVDQIEYRGGLDPTKFPLDRTMVILEYRRHRASSVDTFIPNGNSGPEPIFFIPNTLKPVYESGELANVADAAIEGRGKLNDKTKYQYTISREVYDSEGIAYMLLMHLERIREKTWLWWVPNPVEKGRVAGYGFAIFDQDGTYDPANSVVFESPSDPFPEGSRYRGIYFNPPEDPSDTHGAPPPEEGSAIVRIMVNFSKVMEAGGRSTADIIEQDGYPMGELENVTIDDRGIIVGHYSNYRSLDLAQIALATFTNPSGLKNLEGTMFEETPNSGEPDIGTPETKLRGKVKSGYLEMSNVDLTDEFVKMILAERGFQANSRSITTADRLIMELLRMRP